MPRRLITLRPAGTATATGSDRSDRSEGSERDELFRSRIGNTITEWIGQHCSADGQPTDPLHRLRVTDQVATQIDQLVDDERRMAVLYALGCGLSLADAGAAWGLGRHALAKRWPDLVAQARPYRWLCVNQAEWTRALRRWLDRDDLTAADPSTDPGTYARRLVNALADHANHDTHWWLLTDTPSLARRMIQSVAPTYDEGLAAIRIWLRTLLADYDRTVSGEKRSFPVEVNAASVEAATAPHSHSSTTTP